MKIISAAQFTKQPLTTETDEERIRKIDDTVLNIIGDVRNNGDKALLAYAEKFDKVTLAELRVSEAEFAAAEKSVSSEFIEALQVAKNNITEFHERQIENS